MIEPIDDKESSNEMNERRHGTCKKDSECPKGEKCSIIRVHTSMPPQPVYGCMKPNGNPKNPKQGIKMTFRSSSYSSYILLTLIATILMMTTFYQFQIVQEVIIGAVGSDQLDVRKASGKIAVNHFVLN